MNIDKFIEDYPEMFLVYLLAFSSGIDIFDKEQV